MLEKDTSSIFKKNELTQSTENSREMRLQQALKSNMNRRREQKKLAAVKQHYVNQEEQS